MQQAMTDRRLEEVIQKVEKGTMKMSEQQAITIAGYLFGTGRYKQAENVCRQVIKLRPGVADAHSILGVALNAQGKPKDAISSLKRAVKLSPKNAAYYSNLGELQRQNGNLADAIVALQEAITLSPRNPQAHNNLAIARFDSGNMKEAAECYRKAIELQPNFAEAHNNLGNALRRTGDIDGAIDAYQNALAARERYPEAYNNLGTLLREMGKTEQAEHALRKAIGQNGQYVDAYVNLASLYAADGKDVEALRQLGEVLKIAPREKRALILTARLQCKRTNFAAAERAGRVELTDDPNEAEALTVLGMVLHETDRYDEAVDLLAKAAELAPSNPETLHLYGVALKSVGRLDEARAQILKGVELNPRMVGAYANLNDLVDYSKETDLYERLTKIAENFTSNNRELVLPLHYAYAKALDDNGEHGKALEHYIAGGKLKRSQLNYDEAETHKFFADVKDVFMADFLANHGFEGLPGERLLFIVGMPRSGSTLVEQILASHPAVYGAGEVKYFTQGLHRLRDRFPSLSRFPEMMKELKSNQLKLLGEGYLEAMFRNAGDARIVTDKLLANSEEFLSHSRV